MQLQDFLPYRLAVVADSVSQALAAVYAERFALSRDEWRVLAMLAEHRRLKSSELGTRTTLDKMQVSRAVTRLEDAGLVQRETDAADRRNRIVGLTARGRALHRRIVPMAQAREAFLLEALDDAERAALGRALDKLHQRARQLAGAG